MNLENDQNDDLEFNDGLGDLLKEKSSKQFSWTKTTVVLIAIVIGVFIALTAIFKLSVGFLSSEKVANSGLSQKSKTHEDVNYSESEKQISTKANTLLSESKLALKEKLEVREKKTSKNKSSLSKAKATTIKAHPYKLVAGSFRNKNNAKAYKSNLKKMGIDSYIWVDKGESFTLYRVQIGAFLDYESAKNQEKRLKAKKIQTYIIKN
ncbi:SPOR domain-containing protein [bacterium]|nr:SPOR domain-containing protein [bacterium]